MTLETYWLVAPVVLIIVGFVGVRVFRLWIAPGEAGGSDARCRLANIEVATMSTAAANWNTSA